MIFHIFGFSINKIALKMKYKVYICRTDDYIDMYERLSIIERSCSHLCFSNTTNSMESIYNKWKIYEILLINENASKTLTFVMIINRKEIFGRLSVLTDFFGSGFGRLNYFFFTFIVSLIHTNWKSNTFVPYFQRCWTLCYKN